MAALTDEIWDRALDYDQVLTRPGDIALRNALTFDGLVQNGGLWYAVEVYAVDEEYPIDAIIDGYRTLGLESTASAIERAHAEYEQTYGIGDEEAWGDAEERITDEYPIDTDDIDAALARTYAQEPELFAPA